jgi:hypothetical protein
MNDILGEDRFSFLSGSDKAFMLAFDEEMTRLGYDFGHQIGSGYCWGRYMAIYRRSGVKSNNVYARIYMRDAGIALRLFLNGVDQHRGFLEAAPAHIKQVFVGEHGDCHHCHNDQDGACRFRKTYNLHDRLIEKCSGVVFEFRHPSLERLGDYVALFTEFYPNRRTAQRG